MNYCSQNLNSYKNLLKPEKRRVTHNRKLAQRLKLQQPAIARLEKGGYTRTSVAKLSRIADALGYSIKISLAPKKQK